jgi:hypothetical protein
MMREKEIKAKKSKKYVVYLISSRPRKELRAPGMER